MIIEKKDKTLLEQFYNGDPKAFDQIYKMYSRKVYTFALKNINNKEDAEGIVQSVFLNLWKDKKKLKAIKNLDAWIFTISFNIIRKSFRRMIREKNYLKEESINMLIEEDNVMAEVEFNDLLQRAEKLSEQLPPRLKTVFLLSRKEGLSNIQIAERLKISKKTVANNISSAKSFLKKAFVDGKLLTSLFSWSFIL